FRTVDRSDQPGSARVSGWSSRRRRMLAALQAFQSQFVRRMGGQDRPVPAGPVSVEAVPQVAQGRPQAAP
ncbi:hypothetical protein, partial [Micromonospora nigra]|uniref:hypothetical protein n=1 Tax=Micromonospora nigra TaxID=145857 RepID=UPI001C31848C